MMEQFLLISNSCCFCHYLKSEANILQQIEEQPANEQWFCGVFTYYIVGVNSIWLLLAMEEEGLELTQKIENKSEDNFLEVKQSKYLGILKQGKHKNLGKCLKNDFIRLVLKTIDFGRYSSYQSCFYAKFQFKHVDIFGWPSIKVE